MQRQRFFSALLLAVTWLVGGYEGWPLQSAVQAADPPPQPAAKKEKATGQRIKPVDLIAGTEPLSPAEQRKKFHLPPGFEIELVAAEPDIAKPMNMNFDASGRLFVSTSLEYPFPAKSKPRDSIKVIDTRGLLQRDPVRTFADGLNIPIGVLPVPEGVIGYSIPQITLFKDTDEDGVADQRVVLASGFGSVDTHGMVSSLTLGLDGWVYACHGFANRSKIVTRQGNTLELHSGHTFRFQPNGSAIEIYTHGQVNPFGLTFDHWGNLFSSDCHTKPIYQLLRGAYYPSFGKPHDGLGFGPEMMSHLHGSTGICGVSWYGAENFPPEYHGTFFVCNPVTGTVNHDTLIPQGSTLTAKERPDFLTCDDPWFRPVDSKLGPDGALYIADFYNRIIGHYEVPLTHPQRDRTRGRIWRVTYRGPGGKPHLPPPNLREANSSQLITALGHSNPVVARLAVQQVLAELTEAGIMDNAVRGTAADKSPTQQQLIGLGWCLARRGRGDFAYHLLSRFGKENPVLRTHAVRILGLNSSESFQDRRREQLMLDLLLDSDPFVRRATAEVCAQHPRIVFVAPLLQLWRQTPVADTHLIHATRMALRDVLAALPDPEQALPHVPAEDQPRCIEVMVAIPKPAAARCVINYLEGESARAPIPAEFGRFLLRHVDSNLLPRLYALIESRRGQGNLEQEAIMLGALARGMSERGIEIDPRFHPWAMSVVDALVQGKEVRTVQLGCELVRDMRLQAAVSKLEVVLKNPQFEYAPLKRMAVDMLVELNVPEAFSILVGRLQDPREVQQVRVKSAEGLGALNSAASREALAVALKTAPESLGLGLARALTLSKEGGSLLLDVIERGQASPRYLQDVLTATRLKAMPLPKVEQRISTLLRDLPPEDERSRKLLAARDAGFRKAGGRAALGAAVFTKTCGGCHRIAGAGGKVGPELDGVGLRGLSRLLEDTLTPNRNVDQAFRASTLALKNGRVVSGLALRTEGAVLVLADEQGKEVRVATDEIEERRVLPLSPMPANIAEQLPEQEFYDLLSYLLQQQAKSNPPKP